MFFDELLRGGCGWGLKGAWGVTPIEVWAALCLYHVKSSGGGLLQYDKFSNPDSPALMIVSYWNKPIWNGFHTVCIEYDSGSFTVYNWFNSATRAFSRGSLEEIIGSKERFIYGFVVSR